MGQLAGRYRYAEADRLFIAINSGLLSNDDIDKFHERCGFPNEKSGS